MIKACQLENGGVVRFNGIPHIVESIQVQMPSARGAATLYKVRLRNLQSRNKVDKSFRGDDMLESAEVRRRPAQVLYEKDGRFEFMYMDDYNQFTLSREAIAAEAPFLAENMEGILALESEDKVLGLELPPVVELQITACDPPVRGTSASARTKPATLSTGHVVQIPEYLAPGERVRVDTQTGRFLGRA